jgi:7,8-dihydropterin-6-yl-methyl-4-(beta-D-ribofuranosyl)aminobenzene 5'-phosphate synthase
MKIYVLSDNRAKAGFQSEHGLSFLIDHDNTRVLFDTGSSDLFLQNALKMGIDLGTVDTLVLSHGHFDHGNGLKYLNRKTLICHPGCFISRYRKQDISYIGIELSRTELKQKYTLIESKEPYFVTDRIIFLGEIPRKNSFEAQSTPFVTNNNLDDYVIDDSALALKSEKGLIIITGCSHSGICNIIDYAKHITGFDLVYGVIGGFHLKSDDEQTRETIHYFRKENIQKIYPTHCTAEPALGLFYQELNALKAVAGDGILI